MNQPRNPRWYPCCTCNGSGSDGEGGACRDCQGTGVDTHPTD